MNKNDVLELINQLDEPEAKQLENELSELDSYVRELQTKHDEELKSLDNKIIDLEYDLFLEKTRDSKHSFYWFTAKKTPLVSDVSYTNNENDFYGFKQPPVYSIIEHHDLRFVTNCSLDDLIEQFR